MSRSTRIKILIFIFLVILLSYILNSIKYESENNSLNIQDSSEDDQMNTSKILFWIKYWGDPSWYIGADDVDEKMLKSYGCKVTNCFFTHNKSHMSSVKDFDAILFHGAEHLRDPLPLERSQNQLYIYTTLESPFLCFEDLNRFQNFFNLTMTYRFDSDVQWHYGSFFDKATDKPITLSKEPKWKDPEKGFSDSKLSDIFSKKSPKIAWFASNCKSNSRREILVEKINQHIPVDIYGKCGTHKCDRKSSKCDEILTTDYMFYLSFENALCKDYVTEKLYRPLSEFVIPIVFNGANTSLYAPPKSYIDANDFDTVENLVTYLKTLMSDSDAYLEYFWWKKYYYVKHTEPVFKLGFCDLCMKLQDRNFLNDKHSIGNIKGWWTKQMCTSKGRINF